jgi:hypothetical protein
MGAAAALVLWFALHQMLAGSTPDVPLWLVAAAAALFAGLVWLLRTRAIPGLEGLGAPSGEPDEEGREVPAEEQGPAGTLFLLMIYVMVLAGMWGTMYWILLGR